MIILTDIHGCFDTMLALIEKCKAKYPDRDIVIAGDLIDRGPKSSQVVQYCIDNDIAMVKGNHEDLMVQHNASYRHNLIWQQNGKESTLKSYNGNQELFANHIEWMKNLPLYLHFPEWKTKDGRELVVTHSNIGKKTVWEHRDGIRKEQFENNVLWSRNQMKDIPEIYNVIGHTPNNDTKIKSFYANIDTGCAYGNKLTALVFPEMEIIEQENIDEIQ